MIADTSCTTKNSSNVAKLQHSDYSTSALNSRNTLVVNVALICMSLTVHPQTYTDRTSV